MVVCENRNGPLICEVQHFTDNFNKAIPCRTFYEQNRLSLKPDQLHGWTSSFSRFTWFRQFKRSDCAQPSVLNFNCLGACCIKYSNTKTCTQMFPFDIRFLQLLPKSINVRLVISQTYHIRILKRRKTGISQKRIETDLALSRWRKSGQAKGLSLWSMSTALMLFLSKMAWEMSGFAKLQKNDWFSSDKRRQDTTNIELLVWIWKWKFVLIKSDECRPTKLFVVSQDEAIDWITITECIFLKILDLIITL